MARGVSIHAPAWGATRRSFPACRCGSCFNPRTRVGCDVHASRLLRVVGNVSIHAPAWGATAITAIEDGSFRVSIHAPAWGATRPGQRPRSGTAGFNPRTRVGCDAVLAGNVCREGMFQSTHPRGVRRLMPVLMAPKSMFQSTHPRGVRLGRQCVPLAAVDVSIHAPAWGATFRL